MTEATFPKLCRRDNWNEPILDDPAPRAVRWATRIKMFDPDWGKWHYTEGNGSFTACGEVVRLFEVDGSPQENRLAKVDCRRCKAKMAVAGIASE